MTEHGDPVVAALLAIANSIDNLTTAVTRAVTRGGEHRCTRPRGGRVSEACDRGDSGECRTSWCGCACHEPRASE